MDSSKKKFGTVLNLNLHERFFLIIKDFLDSIGAVDQEIAKCNTYIALQLPKIKY